MRKSTVLEKLRAGGEVYCAKASYHHPEIVEVMCQFPIDAIWMCHEHQKVEPATVRNLIRTCRLNEKDAILRVNPSSYSDLLWILEAGAQAIMLPRVRNIEQVREVVKWLKFPPLGNRGYDGIGPDADFGFASEDNYMEHSNNETFLIVQVEELEITDKLTEIAAMPGIDMLFVGPKDLSLNLRNAGHGKEKLNQILADVCAACRKFSKYAGIPSDPAKIPAYKEIGFNFFNITSDHKCIVNGMSNTTKGLTEL